MEELKDFIDENKTSNNNEGSAMTFETMELVGDDDTTVVEVHRYKTNNGIERAIISNDSPLKVSDFTSLSDNELKIGVLSCNEDFIGIQMGYCMHEGKYIPVMFRFDFYGVYAMFFDTSFLNELEGELRFFIPGTICIVEE